MRGRTDATIRVNKASLLHEVRKNREEHRTLFLEAQGKYRDLVIRELDRRLEQARAGGALEVRFVYPEPVDYTEEYDAVIDALEWDTRDEIDLSHQDFQRYVRNQWEWADHFAAATMSYVG